MTQLEPAVRRLWRLPVWLWLAVIAVLVAVTGVIVLLTGDSSHPPAKVLGEAITRTPSPTPTPTSTSKPGNGPTSTGTGTGQTIASNNGNGNGNGGGGGNNGNGNGGNPGHPITVTGSSPNGLAPGVTKTVTVTVTNPNNQAIKVTAASITVGDASASCKAAGNITTTSYDSSDPAAPLYVAGKNGGKAFVTLSITMLDTPVNQDACKSKSFPLTFTATGVQA